MNLEILRLPSLLMDDAIFARLTKMPTLTEISFDPALVSDELYPNLANLPELTRIRLQSGRIESALIKQLQSMTQITEIVIVAPGKDGMARTYAEEARQKLSAALPGVNVQIELPGHSTEGFEHAERTD